MPRPLNDGLSDRVAATSGSVEFCTLAERLGVGLGVAANARLDFAHATGRRVCRVCEYKAGCNDILRAAEKPKLGQFQSFCPNAELLRDMLYKSLLRRQ